jgi:hypothetical protein
MVVLSNTSSHAQFLALRKWGILRTTSVRGVAGTRASWNPQPIRCGGRTNANSPANALQNTRKLCELRLAPVSQARLPIRSLRSPQRPLPHQNSLSFDRLR